MVNEKALLISFGIFVGLVVVGVILGVIAWFGKNEPHEQKKAKRQQDATVRELPTLQDRVGELARDLYMFLKDNPAPPVEGPDWRATMKEAIKINWERLPKIHDTYMARFHARVEKIIYELGAEGIRDYTLNDLVNKEAHSDADIYSIADKLLALAAQIVANEYRSTYEPKRETKPQEAGMPALRPKIVPVEYGPESPQSSLIGLVIANDGEPAYDVSIPDFPLGKLNVNIRANIPRLTKADGNRFCQVWIDKSENFHVGGGTLFDEMRTREIDEIPFSIRYRDDGHTYVSRCKLERDVTVKGGIVVRYIKQECSDAKAI